MTDHPVVQEILSTIDANPLLERLFFASAELAILGIAVALAIACLRIRSPRACAMLWLIVLAKPVVTLACGAVVPVFRVEPPKPALVAVSPVAQTAGSHSPGWTESGAASVPPPSSVDLVVTPPLVPLPSSAQGDVPVTRDWMPTLPDALGLLWLAGVALLVLTTLVDRFRLGRFMARTSAPADATLEVLGACTRQMELRRIPPLRITREIESPAVVGWFRPVVALPNWLGEPGNENALAWALRHELTHVKHRDPLASAVRRLAQILFFFHPVTWWAGRRWEAAVELACDRAVVRSDDDVTAYAEQLYAMLVQARQQRQRAMAMGLFATRTQINTRIAALLGNALNTPARLGIAAVLSLTLFAGTVFAVGGAIAEKEKAEEVDVADAEKAAERSTETDVPDTLLPARTLNFPEDRSLGMLYLSDPIDYDVAPNKALLMYMLDAWEKLGEARGRVEIPAGKIVRLSATVPWTDEAFAALPANSIQHLNLSADAFSPVGAPLHGVWSGLMALGCSGPAFPPTELPYLAALKNVRWLDLRGTRLESRDLEVIGTLAQLRLLNLSRADLMPIGNDPLHEFSKLTRLQLLDLSRSFVAGEDLHPLSSLGDLANLNLDGCRVANEDLDALAGLKNLDTLSLERTSITDGYKAALAGLPKLTTINIDYTDTPDAEHRAAAVGGRILAEDGQPSPGVDVTLGTDGPAHFSHGRTDADGRWQVLVQAGWTRAAMLVSGGGHMKEITPRILSETEVARLRDGSLEITARPGTSLSGVVLDPGGNPVEGAQILRDDREMPRETEYEVVRTDDEGRFIIKHLDDSQDLALAVLSDRHAPFALHVPAGREKAPVTVTLVEGLVFQGEVRDAREKPVEGVVVTAVGWRPGTDYAPMQDEKRPRVSHSHKLVEKARSGADGKFTISNLPNKGKVQFTLWRTDYFSARMSAEPPYEDDGIVYVVPEAPFRGRVLDADTGGPVTDYEIEFDVSGEDEHFYWREKGQPKVIRDAVTGEFSADLNYTLEAATVPDFAARVTAEGYARTESTIVTADRLGEVVTIKLRRLDVSQIDTLAPGTGE